MKINSQGFKFTADGFDSLIDAIRVSEEELVKIRVTISILGKMVICAVVDGYMCQVKIIAESIQKMNSFQVTVNNVEVTPQENLCFCVKFMKVIKTTMRAASSSTKRAS